jgi:tetratricopeptide (TPR) repeat protein
MNRLQQLIEMHQQDPTDSFLRFALAKEYEKAEDWENAFSYYKGLITHQPNYVGTYYHLAKLHEVHEEWEDALRTYETGMSVAEAENDKHALRELQEAYAMLKAQLD